MKISPLLAALGGGAAGLAMGGPNGSAMAGLSPMLAMLMAQRKRPAPAAQPTAPSDPAASVVAPTASPLAAPQPLASAPATLPQAMPGLPQMNTGGMDPASRQRLASMLLQFGAAQSSPFGPRY